MGHSPILKPKTVEFSPSVLRSETITSLLTMGVSRICWHQ